MNRFNYIFGLVLLPCLLFGQSAELNNAANLYLHSGATVGMHINLFNQGEFNADENSLMGFYGEIPNIIDGVEPINLYDVEFGNDVGTFLRVRMNVRNNVNFISGNIVTPINISTIFLNFEENAFYTGANDDGKLIGFGAMTNTNEFIFPVGDRDELRPLVLNTTSPEGTTAATYLRENASNTTTLNRTFNTEQKVRDVGEISASEFWVIDSNLSNATITLNWNFRSNLSAIAQDVSEVIIVGWNKAVNQWLPLSGTTAVGDLEQGIITTDSFNPSEYDAITFAALPLPFDTFAVENPSLGEYFLSPNNDGINDALVFDDLEGTGENMVHIYDKFGRLVFQQANYTNEFRGVANTGSFILKQEIGLPAGIYYYTISLPELQLNYQGYFFIDR